MGSVKETQVKGNQGWENEYYGGHYTDSQVAFVLIEDAPGNHPLRAMLKDCQNLPKEL